MKKTALFLIALITLVACSTEETNLTVSGKVQGLKKGTLYLQKIQDTALVTIDSIKVQGDPTFSFSTYIEEPQIFYLYLNKKDNAEYDDRILFFAEPGEIVINTTLQNFEANAVVEGSENQQKLMEYKKMMQRFNDRNLELIQSHFQAQQENDSDRIEQTTREFDNLLRRRYLSTVNFAINNKDKELAPYLAISEIHDANIKYLDTIYKSLTPEVKDSRYGRSLQEFLEERREMEKAQNESSSDESATENV